MRYWFRVFALGILPNDVVKTTEKRIFGGIDPKTRGCLSVCVCEYKDKHLPLSRQSSGEQKGRLILTRSSEPVPTEIKDQSSFEANLEVLAQELIWLAFHLGGVGQGARRPLYSRNNRTNGRPPWWRGSTIVPTYSNSFKKPQNFANEFRGNLHRFYEALDLISLTSRVPLRSLVQPCDSTWVEAADAHCQIWLVPNSAAAPLAKPNPTARPSKPGASRASISGEKPKSLETLHGLFHSWFEEYQVHRNSPDRQKKAEAYQALSKAKNLCGHTEKDRPWGAQGAERGATPSPVWIASHENYQVVTVFGATQAPRRTFLEALPQAICIFPLP